MNRGSLKRRIRSCDKSGKEEGGRGNFELKKICNLTEIQFTGNEVAKVKAHQLAADEYENYLSQINSVPTSLAQNTKSDTAANLCGSPLQSSKVNYLKTSSPPQLPKCGEQDATSHLLNETRQLSRHDLNGVSELPGVLFVTEQQRTYEECHICKKDISCCNEEQRQQHTNRCIVEVENAEQEKKNFEETAEILCTDEVLNCPVCWRKLKTQNARRVHLKKCAARFCISPMNLIELIRKQEEDHQNQLLSISLQGPSEELGTAKRKPALVKRKRSRAVKNRFEEPHSKLEEDTHLAIALSTSIEDGRKSLADFISYTQPVVNKPKEDVTESPPLIDATLNPLHHSSKDAFLLLIAQKTDESSISTIRGKKNKVAKQPSALLALDQDEVKRRLAEKATALVLQKTNISSFYDAEMPCFPESKLSARYCHKKSKDFLWCLATQNTEKLCNYYVKELVHPIVLGDAANLSLQQKHFNWQMPDDERPEPLTSVLYGSTQTALVLAELAAEAGTEASFADDSSQKSLYNYQDVQKQPPSAIIANGFYLPTDEVCEKASTALLNAWSRMVDNDCMSDLTVDCRDGEVIRLHRLVIMARYPNLLQVLESESSAKVFSQVSKMAALSVVRFIYAADTDVCHAVVFEAKQLAESLQLTEFCKICEDVVKAYDLIERTAPAASSATEEELVLCNWSSGLDPMQRDEEDLCGGSENAVEEEEEEEVGDTDLDEMYAFMLTQRRNQMNRDGIIEDEDNESDSSKRNLEDDDDSQLMAISQSYSGLDDEDEDALMLPELNHAASASEKLTNVFSSEKSHEVVIGHVSCDSALTSGECTAFGAKTFSEETLIEKKECSSVHVKSSGKKVQQGSNSFLIDHMINNSNRAIDIVAIEDEAGECLSEEDDERNVLPQESGKEFAAEYSAGAKLYDGKDDSRDSACLVGGLCCVSVDIHPFDSADVCAVDSFDTNQHGGNEPKVPYTLVFQQRSASSSSSSSASSSSSSPAQRFVSSSGSASDSTEAISKHPSGLVSTCLLSSDNLSPDLFPSSPCSESLVSSAVAVQEPCVLIQASQKLNKFLDTDEVFRGVLETNESMIDDGRNLSTGVLRRGFERQSEDKWAKCGHTVPTLKINSDSSIYLEKNILETHCHSQVNAYCFSQDNPRTIDAELPFLSQMSKKLTDEDSLPDLDDDDVKAENPAGTTRGLSLTSAFLNCSEICVKNNNMTSSSNEIEDGMCVDEILFPHDITSLNLSPDVEIGAKSSKINETFVNCLVLPPKSSSSCRINSSVVTDEVENDCEMSEDITSTEIQVVETSDEEYCERKRRTCVGDDCADYAANDDDDNKNATQHISIQCDDEVSAAVLDSDERICDEENIWEKFPEEEFLPLVSFENERNTSLVQLASITPESGKMQGQSAPGNNNYSPPTDMETDVSALMEDVIANSSLLNSDASFETSDGPSRTVINPKLPVVNVVKQVNYEFGGKPVTPLPSYGQMNTPVLQQRCHDYGIRRLPKKQMVGVLQNIFLELHPGIPKPETVKPKQNANKKTKAVTNKGNCASFLPSKRSNGHVAHQQDNRIIQMTGHPAAAVTSSELCHGRTGAAKQTTAEILTACSDSESDNYLDSENHKRNVGNDEDEEENSLEYGADESLLIQNEKTTKSGSLSKQDDCLKKEILVSFFSKSTDLYQRILNYEPLELDYLKNLLKEKKIKVTSHFLIDFLDEQNILFTTRNNRAACSSHRLPAKGKAMSQPPSQNKNNVLIK